MTQHSRNRVTWLSRYERCYCPVNQIQHFSTWPIVIIFCHYLNWLKPWKWTWHVRKPEKKLKGKKLRKVCGKRSKIASHHPVGHGHHTRPGAVRVGNLRQLNALALSHGVAARRSVRIPTRAWRKRCTIFFKEIRKKIQKFKNIKKNAQPKKYVGKKRDY